jgi:putative transposase
MKRSKFSEEQIVYAIRQAESGTPVGDLCRQLGVSDATFYAWKKKYAHLGVSELRRLRQLEEENSRLKRLVADLSLDKHMLSEALRKKSEARPPPRTRRVVSGHVPGAVCAGLPVSAIQSSCLVSTELGEGSIRSPDTDSRSRPGPTPVWVSADLGVAASGRLAGESEARPTTVPARWITATDASAAAEAHRAAPRPRSNAGRTDGAVEYGFCA